MVRASQENKKSHLLWPSSNVMTSLLLLLQNQQSKFFENTDISDNSIVDELLSIYRVINLPVCNLLYLLASSSSTMLIFFITRPDLDIRSIEYFFADNISSCLVLNYDLMSSDHFANSEVHHLKAR